jgi:hypothetical protein
MTASDVTRGSESLYRRAHEALAEGLRAAKPDAAFRGRHVRDLTENLSPYVDLSSIVNEFAAGAGRELESKMHAPWSSAILAANSFAPLRTRCKEFTVAGFAVAAPVLQFEARCPNGVARTPPHLDALADDGERVVAIESKCTEWLRPREAPAVADAYLALAEQGDDRAGSAWFAALEHVPDFEWLDAYQLVKHYLGLRRTFPERDLVLVYVFWEPVNAEEHAPFVAHRREVERFSAVVAKDPACEFSSIAYADHWSELERAIGDEWIGDQCRYLRARYEVAL